MRVLRFEKGRTEEEEDKHFLETALNLGINVPQDAQTTLQVVTDNVSALTLASTTPEPRDTPSRASESTHPISCSSSEGPQNTKTPSLATTSMTSAAPSVSSISSEKSSYAKIKKSIRRISTFGRRKALGVITPPLPIPTGTLLTLQVSQNRRPLTTDFTPTATIPRKPIPPRNHSIPSLSSPLSYYTPLTLPNQEPLIEEHPAARQRSLEHPRLKALRSHQLQERSRFIRFECDQYRLMRSNQEVTRCSTIAHQQKSQQALQDRHAEALSYLEHRHLSSEVDLERTLNLERQACLTRLKHMEAYCNSKGQIEGMPQRTVTNKDFRELAQQYHVRNGMSNLHEARINVLREKQAKQLERITAKQEIELSKLTSDSEQELQDLDIDFTDEENALQQEFAERKKRLIARWTLAEAIERRKLENETGEAYGSLPAIAWPMMRRSSLSYKGSLLGEEGVVYDAALLEMI